VNNLTLTMQRLLRNLHPDRNAFVRPLSGAAAAVTAIGATWASSELDSTTRYVLPPDQFAEELVRASPAPPSNAAYFVAVPCVNVPVEAMHSGVSFMPAGMISTGVLPTGMLPTGMVRTGMVPAGMMHPGMVPAGMVPYQVPASNQQLMWSTADRWSVWPVMWPTSSVSQDFTHPNISGDPVVQDCFANAKHDRALPADSAVEQVAFSSKEGPRRRRKQRKSAAELVIRDILLKEPAGTRPVPGSPGLSACSTDMDDFDCAHSTSSHSSVPLVNSDSKPEVSEKQRWADVDLDEEVDFADYQPAAKKKHTAARDRAADGFDMDAVDEAVDILGAGDEAKRNGALKLLLGSVWQLANSQQGCRSVQKALVVANATDKAALATELEGHVWEASKSPNGNYVLQKCIELLPPERVQFIVEELGGHGVPAARHRFGVRVLQRLIEHCPASQTEQLVVEVLSDAARLCRHPFGNFFLQHLLEYGTPRQRGQVVDVLLPEIVNLSRHRIASNVVGCALKHSSQHDRDRLAYELGRDAEELKSLSHSQFGSFVVREMLGKQKMSSLKSS